MNSSLQADRNITEQDCAKCGACVVVCPVFKVDRRESLTARGKMHLLSTDLAECPSAVFENLFSCCLLCGACEQVCPRHLPITDIVSRARSHFSIFYGQRGLRKVAVRSLLARPSLLEGLVRAGISLKRLNALPARSGLRLKLGLLENRTRGTDSVVSEQKPVAAEISYFSGCLARHLQPSVAEATRELLDHCSQVAHEPVDQCCCGLAAWSAGKRVQAADLARKNIQAFAGSDGPIITSCASCSAHLFSYPELFDRNDPWHERARQFAGRIREFTAFFNEALPEAGEKTIKSLQAFYHDPCHLRFRKNGRENPRSLLKKMNVQVVEPDQGPSCCGQGGLFHLGYPETSDRIFSETAGRALAGRPDCITTTCSGCLMQYQQGMARQHNTTRVVHLAVLLVEVLGRVKQSD